MYSAAAAAASDLVWERGILLKGDGLCHGLCGNLYTFIEVWRRTADPQQLSRAHAFAAVLLDDAGWRAAVGKQPDKQRRVRGMPDKPLSLMEGSAGVVACLLDLCAPESATFPGWGV